MFTETHSKTVTQITAIMATEDAVGIQTRAMTEAQCMENEAQQNAANNQEEGQGTVQGTGEIVRDPTYEPCSRNPQKRRHNHRGIRPMPRWNRLRLVCTRLSKHTS